MPNRPSDSNEGTATAGSVPEAPTVPKALRQNDKQRSEENKEENIYLSRARDWRGAILYRTEIMRKIALNLFLQGLGTVCRGVGTGETIAA